MSREAKKPKQEKCKKCGTPLNAKGRCNDKTCPYSDQPQSWNYDEEADKSKLTLAEGGVVSDKRGVIAKSAEGTAKPAEPAKAESTKGEAKEKKKESKTHIHKYVTEVSKRCTLPTELVDKLHKCDTKGEAKSLVKAYLQGNSI